MIYPFKQTTTLPNGARISVRGELKFWLNNPLGGMTPDLIEHVRSTRYPDVPATEFKEYDEKRWNTQLEASPYEAGWTQDKINEIIFSELNKWGAKQNSVREALAGYESLEQRLNKADFSCVPTSRMGAKGLTVTGIRIIKIRLEEDQRREDEPLSRVKTIVKDFFHRSH